MTKLKFKLSTEPEAKEDHFMDLDADLEPEAAAELHNMELQELDLWRKAHSMRKPDGTGAKEEARIIMADAQALGRARDEKRRKMDRALDARAQEA